MLVWCLWCFVLPASSSLLQKDIEPSTRHQVLASSWCCPDLLHPLEVNIQESASHNWVVTYWEQDKNKEEETKTGIGREELGRGHRSEESGETWLTISCKFSVMCPRLNSLLTGPFIVNKRSRGSLLYSHLFNVLQVAINRYSTFFPHRKNWTQQLHYWPHSSQACAHPVSGVSQVLIPLSNSTETGTWNSAWDGGLEQWNQPWIFTGRTDAKAPILWSPDVKSWVTIKDPDADAGKDWRQKEKRAAEDEMVGWHHRLSESEQTPGDGEGQRSLACCCPWDRRESDVT